MKVETIGAATLYLGDCREILPRAGVVDAVVTDPPYGLGDRLQGGKREWVLHGGGQETAAWDAIQNLDLVLAAAPHSVIWGGNYYGLEPKRGWLIWDKGTSGFSTGDAELAWTTVDKPIRRLRLGTNIFTPIIPNYEKKVHPTQKPTELMRWSIEYLPKESQLICDPFMGSGSTGVAAVKLGRKFIGIEIDPKYFDMACRRIDEAARQPMLLKS